MKVLCLIVLIVQDAKKKLNGENPVWKQLSERMEKIELVFEEIDINSAAKKCGETLPVRQAAEKHHEVAYE